MKTKLTLNIDDTIIARAKKISAKQNVSLSSVVEDYLDKFSKNNVQQKNVKHQPSLLERIRKYTHPIKISDEELDKKRDEYLKKKYGL